MVNAFRSGLDTQRAHLFLRRAQAMKSSSLDAQSQMGELIAAGKFARISGKLTHSLSLEEAKRRQLQSASSLSSGQNSVDQDKNAVETAV